MATPGSRSKDTPTSAAPRNTTWPWAPNARKRPKITSPRWVYPRTEYPLSVTVRNCRYAPIIPRIVGPRIAATTSSSRELNDQTISNRASRNCTGPVADVSDHAGLLFRYRGQSSSERGFRDPFDDRRGPPADAIDG